MDLFNDDIRTELTVNQVGSDFQTPMDVARYMVSMMDPLASKILEPTPGQGNIVAAIKESGRENIIAPADFFLLQPDKYDCIIMNPPFSSKYAFLDNAKIDFTAHGMRLGYHMLALCMELSDEIIALMPWFTISDSDVRLRFLYNFGLYSITALPRKTFQYARIQTIVLHLKRGYRGGASFKIYPQCTNDTKVQILF